MYYLKFFNIYWWISSGSFIVFFWILPRFLFRVDVVYGWSLNRLPVSIWYLVNYNLWILSKTEAQILIYKTLLWPFLFFVFACLCLLNYWNRYCVTHWNIFRMKQRKLWSRTSQLDQYIINTVPSPAQNLKMNVPKHVCLWPGYCLLCQFTLKVS